MNDMHGIIFAYRTNSELKELAEHRAAASMPFGGRYRIIDFVLSNMINAGIHDVGVIMHRSYQSLLDHLGSGKDWDLSRRVGGLKLLPPFAFADSGSNSFRGRMEALSGVYSYLEKIRQDYVLLAQGDIAANIPLDKVFRQHIEAGADITAVCTSKHIKPPQESCYFIEDGEGFAERAVIRPNLSPRAPESLEIYILSRDTLLDLVKEASFRGIYHLTDALWDEGSKVLKTGIFKFDGYTASVGSVAAYYKSSMELLLPRVRQELFLPGRPVRTKERSDPSAYYGDGAVSKNCLVADGCYIEGEIENSVLFRGVRIEKGARVKNCVLMQDTVVREGAELSCVITDKRVTISSYVTLIGHEKYPITISKDSIV